MTYGELDSLIIDAISVGVHPLYERKCNKEADRIAHLTGRESFRIIDGRIQYLRKDGKIAYITKSKGCGFFGWKVMVS